MSNDAVHPTFRRATEYATEYAHRHAGEYAPQHATGPRALPPVAPTPAPGPYLGAAPLPSAPPPLAQTPAPWAPAPWAAAPWTSAPWDPPTAFPPLPPAPARAPEQLPGSPWSTPNGFPAATYDPERDTTSRWMAWPGLGFGVLGIAIAWIPWVGLLGFGFGVLALALSFAGRARVLTRGGDGLRVSYAGIGTGAFAMLIAVLMTLLAVLGTVAPTPRAGHPPSTTSSDGAPASPATGLRGVTQSGALVDQAYLDAVGGYGVPTTDRDGLIEVGQGVCGQWMDGATFLRIVDRT